MNPTLLLAIATLALVVGPLFDKLARRVPVVPALIDGATVGGIVVVSLLHLMPEAGAHIGWWALVLLAVGLVLPVFAERLLASSTGNLKLPLGALIVILFMTHELIESAALATKANEERVGIATLLVVVGHRLPLGLLLWGQTKRRFGATWSLVTLAAVASFTWFGPVLVPVAAEGTFTAVLSALLAGGLLHLVLQHAPASEHQHENEGVRHAWSAVGMLTAVAFFVPYLISSDAARPGHEHGTAQVPGRLEDLLLATALPLLIGVCGAALIEAFLPASLRNLLGRGPRWKRVLMGVAVGTPVPMCSCGVLPIYRSLMRKGVGATAGLAFLIAAPEIDLSSVLLSVPLLGTHTTIARLACALVLALVIGWVVGALAERETLHAEHEPEHDEPRPAGAVAAVRHALLETWGHLSPWILAGLVLTVLAEPWISTEWASGLSPWVQVVVLSLAGMPTYICAAAATPFAALLLAKGFSSGAVIAFLLTGPATNFTTFLALRRLHSARVALTFVATAFASTCLLGFAVDALLPPQVRALPGEGAHGHGALEWAAAVVLGALTLWVLFRQGPRTYLAQLWSSVHEDGHGHAHDAPGG